MRIALFVLVQWLFSPRHPFGRHHLSGISTAHKIPVNLFSLVDDRYQNHDPRADRYHPHFYFVSFFILRASFSISSAFFTTSTDRISLFVLSTCFFRSVARASKLVRIGRQLLLPLVDRLRWRPLIVRRLFLRPNPDCSRSPVPESMTAVPVSRTPPRRSAFRRRPPPQSQPVQPEDSSCDTPFPPAVYHSPSTPRSHRRFHRRLNPSFVPSHSSPVFDLLCLLRHICRLSILVRLFDLMFQVFHQRQQSDPYPPPVASVSRYFGTGPAAPPSPAKDPIPAADHAHPLPRQTSIPFSGHTWYLRSAVPSICALASPVAAPITKVAMIDVSKNLHGSPPAPRGHSLSLFERSCIQP